MQEDFYNEWPCKPGKTLLKLKITGKKEKQGKIIVIFKYGFLPQETH